MSEELIALKYELYANNQPTFSSSVGYLVWQPMRQFLWKDVEEPIGHFLIESFYETMSDE